ncbi:MAG TPA: hypothetical protein DDW96_00900 [Synergistaceae bacterium]|nr:hypothetical protein [Synergistaceae bacterium]HCP07315.1 hypothetical protein [Synergistaceae bacterium]HCR39006.1 hypothetical protein [Synergistaceae bacterium]
MTKVPFGAFLMEISMGKRPGSSVNPGKVMESDMERNPGKGRNSLTPRNFTGRGAPGTKGLEGVRERCLLTVMAEKIKKMALILSKMGGGALHRKKYSFISAEIVAFRVAGLSSLFKASQIKKTPLFKRGSSTV